VKIADGVADAIQCCMLGAAVAAEYENVLTAGCVHQGSTSFSRYLNPTFSCTNHECYTLEGDFLLHYEKYRSSGHDNATEACKRRRYEKAVFL
jgi:hypothetical protein